jgi:uncharacterized protein YjbI with pentapeptide repeats
MTVQVKLFLLFAMCLSAVEVCYAGSTKPCSNLLRPREPAQWTWVDRDKNVHTRTDLDQILSRHQKWLKKYALYLGSDEALAQHGALQDPLRADLSGANLMYADLPESHLAYADLSGAQLFMVNLAGADLYHTDLDHADSPSCLVGSDLRFADFTGANLSAVDMSGARLAYADLTGKANLEFASLRGADLSSADLSGGNLRFVDLSAAQLKDTELDNVDLSFAKLRDTDFEPKALPPANTIARADGLRTLCWERQPGDSRSQSIPGIWVEYLAWYHEHPIHINGGFPGSIALLLKGLVAQIRQRQAKPELAPSAVNRGSLSNESEPSKGNSSTAALANSYPILDLRKSLHDAGYQRAELEVNLAYERGVQSTWQMVILDWTCEWGANWQRPICIAAFLGLLSAVMYWCLIRFTCRNFLFVIGRIGDRERQVRTPNRYTRPGWLPDAAALASTTRMKRFRRVFRTLWVRARWELRVVSTATLFSAMSVLNLGVQGLDLGRWVRLMHRRDFDLQARGTIRLMAGIQSILSFLLLALAALSYFGHPFE